jgi:hypothetical protein
MNPVLAAVDPRGWLMSQPQLLVVVFAGAVWLVKMFNRAKSAASGASGAKEPVQPEPAGEDVAAQRALEDEERRQTVREDILRKIAERRARASASPQPATLRVERVPPAPPPVSKAPPYVSRASAEGPPAAATAGALPPAPAAIGGFPAFSPSGPLAGVVTAPSAGALWLDDLRSRDVVRRAILVREILGPPVALR